MLLPKICEVPFPARVLFPTPTMSIALFDPTIPYDPFDIIVLPNTVPDRIRMPIWPLPEITLSSIEQDVPHSIPV